MQLARRGHTFTAEGIWIPRGSLGAEEPVGDVLLHCHVGGLGQSLHRVLHAASPLSTEKSKLEAPVISPSGLSALRITKNESPNRKELRKKL